MDMGWDYQYYQSWSDNEWLLQDLMDDNTIMKEEGEYDNELNKDRDIGLLDNSWIILRLL